MSTCSTAGCSSRTTTSIPLIVTLDQRDNWLVGKQYYLKAIDAVDNKGKSIGRKSPRIFYSSPAMSQMNYSEAIEEDGFFDKARRGWIEAQQEWETFGRMPVQHSTGVILHLGEQEDLEAQIAKFRDDLDALAPGVRDKLAAAKLAALTPEEKEAHDTPADKRTRAQAELAYRIPDKLAVTDHEVAEQIAKDDPAKSKQALQLANELDRQNLRLRYTISYKNDSNYDYWYTRAKLEQTPDALAAREAIFKASRAFKQGDVLGARKLYEEGFAKWRQVLRPISRGTGKRIVDRRRPDRLHPAISQSARSIGRAAGRRLPALGRGRAFRQRAKVEGRLGRPQEARRRRQSGGKVRLQGGVERQTGLRRQGKARCQSGPRRSAKEGGGSEALTTVAATAA